ncbi:bifunctional sugar phosphate isomerase/epimerase/4-hydroxyphenylpyruvate dioxygenase family protein [Novosphingobium lentum]|uniref:bifunctional sugar phosphate isomerase/epimerase/4-hydroxyphenylpyruvate dioxygenase family protein n=1 Tax=Novosphingobium lentum TaxID=145287 RepID=UPI00082EB03C|nr:sugar phosphate isomerase/epimerase and 4-hydroxyphenylpyruvate domain-containing protein [Novosphingobium lentum]
MPGVKTSIATVSISGALDAKLQAIASAGFNGAEIFENDLLSSNLGAREIAALMRDLGLACTMFQPFRDLEGLPEPLRARAFDRLERKFDVMAELGTDLLLLCSSCSPQSLGDRNRILADLHEAGERAAARGLRIGYEGLAWGRHVNDHRDAWALVRDVDHPALGLVLDSFHSLARRIPSSSIGDIRADKLFIVQVGDAPLLEMDYLGWSRHFRCMPGQGDLPLDDWADAIRRIGYQGYWSLEIFNDRFRAGSAKGVALDGYRSLRLLEGGIGRSAAITAASLPPRPVPRGVEFIEFAASHEEAEALGTMLRPLGFRPTARHRSKDVTRWTQGPISLVINCEPEGLAHSFDIVHGASVCAIGLTVDNVAGAMARADALRVQRFEQAIGPDEWPIPSVRGVGGSLLYFVDAASRAAMWAHEFPVPLEPAAPALLSGIDHIAQTMQFEEFLSWLLFYVSLLDLTKTPQLEIADPMGLVQSQAVESADGSVRFTLNGSLATGSLSSRFIQNYFGAGVQHIAFACADIFAAADAAIAGGVERLEIPRNYYDDLEARWGLDPELIEAMAARDILYDRDGDAEYFQFYTRAFARRVFFELVERRDYAGYGAVNAPIRLAAQARHKPEFLDGRSE